MNDVLVREAVESDLPAIGELIKELVEAMEDKQGTDVHSAIRNCQALLNHANSHILIAEARGSVVGFVNFTVRQTILHPGSSGLIDELVVSKPHRGKGIGRQLMRGAIKRCKQLGCCEVEVSTEKTNHRAKKFYGEWGFKERGILFELDL